MAEQPPATASQQQFAIPTLLALTIIAADSAGVDLGANRDPQRIGALFDLPPNEVQAYCHEVFRRISVRIQQLGPRLL